MEARRDLVLETIAHLSAEKGSDPFFASVAPKKGADPFSGRGLVSSI
jgi:hypothetical protein